MNVSALKFRHIPWMQAGGEMEIMMNREHNNGFFKYSKIKEFWGKKNIV